MLEINGEIIETTDIHPFWVLNNGWVEAQNLKAGDLMVSWSGTACTLQNIARKANSTTVYNLEVAGFHTYFVAEDGILVHNGKCLPFEGSDPDPDLARQMTSEEQTAQALAGKGEPIYGAGTSKPLTDANRLAGQYGGNPADWAKMGGENSATHGATTPAGNNFEIHWYENTKTGQIVELKTKVAGH